jgi:hypothetical protein
LKISGSGLGALLSFYPEFNNLRPSVGLFRSINAVAGEGTSRQRLPQRVDSYLP